MRDNLFRRLAPAFTFAALAAVFVHVTDTPQPVTGHTTPDPTSADTTTTTTTTTTTNTTSTSDAMTEPTTTGTPDPATAGTGAAGASTTVKTSAAPTPTPRTGESGTSSSVTQVPTPKPTPVRPTPTPSVTTSTRPATNRSIDGDPQNTRYGVVQVRVTVDASGKIVDLTPLQLPGGRNGMYSSFAATGMRSAILQAQSADVDLVSGASYTSDGYRRSVQSALDKR